MSENKKEWIIALITLGFSLATTFYFFTTPIELSDEYARRSLSPAFYPQLPAWIIALLSLLFIVKRFRRSAQSPEKKGSDLSLAEELRVVHAFVAAFFFADGAAR